MKVSDLIDQLEELKREHGNIDVRLSCDHGQELMRSTYVGVSYIKVDEYAPEYISEDEIEDYADEYPIKVIEIQAY